MCAVSYALIYTLSPISSPLSSPFRDLQHAAELQLQLYSNTNITGRLVRLIPDDPSDPDAAEERRSLRRLFNHRLSADPARARIEWLDVVEGRDRRLWRDIDSEKRELIRSIFNLVNLEIVKRARPSSTFNFSKASIGNLFLTG